MRKEHKSRYSNAQSHDKKKIERSNWWIRNRSGSLKQRSQQNLEAENCDLADRKKEKQVSMW